MAMLAVMQAFLAYRVTHRARHDVRNLHVEVNSRLTELLQATSEAAHLAGHARGTTEERERRRIQNGVESDG